MRRRERTAGFLLRGGERPAGTESEDNDDGRTAMRAVSAGAVTLAIRRPAADFGVKIGRDDRGAVVADVAVF